jgi:hypothetical protein
VLASVVLKIQNTRQKWAFQTGYGCLLNGNSSRLMFALVTPKATPGMPHVQRRGVTVRVPKL